MVSGRFPEGVLGIRTAEEADCISVDSFLAISAAESDVNQPEMELGAHDPPPRGRSRSNQRFVRPAMPR